MIEFLNNSENFGGIYFNGCFDMDLEHLEFMYNFYKRTGINPLDDYCEIYHCLSVVGDDICEFVMNNNERGMNHEEVDKIRENLKSEPFNDMFSKTEKMKIDICCNKYLRNYIYWQKKNKANTRERADRYISNHKIRNWVFKKYGKKCLACGSVADIALDHIIPISKGGENAKNNLQPLCKSCNSKKRNKIIDYRNGTT